MRRARRLLCPVDGRSSVGDGVREATGPRLPLYLRDVPSARPQEPPRLLPAAPAPATQRVVPWAVACRTRQPGGGAAVGE